MAIIAEDRRLVHEAMNELAKNGHCITTESIALFVKTKHGKYVDMEVIADIQREQTKNIARRLSQ
jgi:hypothetical protein